jgi:hypothetical protein
LVTGALLYCAVYLVSGLWERRPVRLETAPAKLERADAVPILRAPEAPAPDMSSEDVRFAAADVAVSQTLPAKTPEATKIAVKAPQKRKVHIVAKPKNRMACKPMPSASPALELMTAVSRRSARSDTSLALTATL